MTDDATAGVNILEGEQTSAALPAAITKAVAIEYDREDDTAPRVTASGKGLIADQILAIAFARGIKVRKDEDLVEVLSKIDIDSPIPLEAFAAVAEILAYVYKANASMKQRKARNLHRE